MGGIILLVASLGIVWSIAYFRLSIWLWTLLIALIFGVFAYLGWIEKSIWIGLPLFIGIALILNIRPLRMALLTKPLFSHLMASLPVMSQTEREAIEAGEVGWEKELFQGKPNWQKLMKMPKLSLNEEEEAFLKTQVNQLCHMLHDWEIVHEKANLPEEVWAFLRAEKFFGMIIPKKYGGLEFSVLAHSTVITQIAIRSASAAITVMVPNALGPAELLLKYGTEEQKEAYLPKLAKGIEIPCFALTGPEAGSDAGAIPDTGIICKGVHEGKEIIGIRLDFDKRYITLAPVATVIGLAFKLYDPDHLLGEQEALGITLCLIPANHPGVEVGARHFPLNLAFMNGPVRGKAVFIPMHWIIGGEKQIGQGWRMLVECLAAGRGISLPALSTATGLLASRMTGIYALMRRQFSLPIAQFEGVSEALTRIVGLTYVLEASRRLTIIGIETYHRPSVATAIAKYHMTEMARKIMNDAMDIHGGRGIMMGPANYLARGYQGMPISITVEGANILTRNLIIFGQGAIRCHPEILNEIKAAQLYPTQPKEAAKLFDKSCMKHMGYFISNVARMLVFSLSRGHWGWRTYPGSAKKYIKKLNWMSVVLSVCSDIALITLGGELKRKEKLSARLGDVLSQLYLASAILKYDDEEGEPEENRVIVEWALKRCLYLAQEGLYAFFQNFPHRLVGNMLKWVIFPLGRVFSPPSDALSYQVAKLAYTPSLFREMLSKLSFVGEKPDDPSGFMECAFQQYMLASSGLEKLDKAIKAKQVDKKSAFEDQIKEAQEKQVIDEKEASNMRKFEEVRKKVIAVDEFPSTYPLGVKQNATTTQYQ